MSIDKDDPSPGEPPPTPGRLVTTGHAVPAPRTGYGVPSPYGIDPLDAEPDFATTLLTYWHIVWKRKGLIASIVAACVALGGLRTLMMTPLYTATVRLQIDRNVAKVVEGGNITPVEGTDLEFLKTQYELLQSRAIAERVVSALKLGQDESFLTPTQFSLLAWAKDLVASAPSAGEDSPSSKAELERTATGIVLENRSVRPVPGSRLVDVSYDDPVPGRAQRIAAAFGDAFIASNLDKRFQANAYAKTFLEDQIKQLKLRLEQSEKAQLDFAQKEQIVTVNEKSSIAENNLAAANTALGNLISERIKNEQLWRQVEKGDAINLPQILTNSVIDGLRGKRNALVTDYQEKLETFKPSYPAMVQIDNKIKEIDRQLATEVATIKDSLKAGYQASLNQETETKARIEALRTELLDLQKRSIQYNILKREVDTNRALYENLLQRFKEVDIAGGVGANNVFVVDQAQLPRFPSSPKISQALLLSFALGLGASFGVAYVLERLDDSVRSAEDLEQLAGLATLGIIPKVSAVKGFETEFADPRSALSEAYRSLCTALQFSTENGLPKTLLVTSSGPAEGKSSTSLAIARHFANMGLKVLIVDADLRNASLHKKLNLDNSIGLSNYLTGACTPPETFQKTSVGNLAFMASGPLPPNAADLLGGSRLLSLVSIGLQVFDLIVIDGPPIMGLADVPLLSTAVGGTAFIVGAGQARKSQVVAALKRLNHARAHVIGTVLTKYDARTAGYGYGYG